MGTERALNYLKQPYSRVLMPDEGGGYTAQILEFPGCVAEGDTAEEALRNLESAAGSWLEAALDLGQEIPSPHEISGYSGKIALRLPKSLHKQASVIAAHDGVSLNQFLVTAIAEKVGVQKTLTAMWKTLP